MEGASIVSDSYTERARAALAAGCDMVLICNNREGALEILDGLQDYTDPVAHLRLARMHGLHPVTRQQLHQMHKWKDTKMVLEKYQDDPSLTFDF